MDKSTSLHKQNIVSNLDTFFSKFSKIPTVCVDMDGTLIKEDVTWDSFMYIIKNKPYLLFKCLYWLLRGRAYFKYKIETVSELDFDKYQYNHLLINYLKKLKIEMGDNIKLVLVTAANEKLARIMFNRLSFFDEYIGSNSKKNYRARYKAKILNEIYGKEKYIYAGNSYDDLKVWCDSAAIIAVVDDDKLRNKITNLDKITVYCYGFDD